MPTPIWKEKAEELNVKADAQADSFLDKLKALKWTGAILIAGALVLMIVILTRFF